MNESTPVPANDASPAEVICANAPVGLLAELTHRCPLQCSYCSNPLEMDRPNEELTTEQWQSVMRQAGEMGVLQLHLSGGEPTARQDLEEILDAAVKAGLYTNLITAGVLLKKERLQKLADIGLDHVQLSIQDVDPKNAQIISNYKGGAEKKREVARWTREIGMPLTINAPLHRMNIASLKDIIDYSVEVGAERLEVAHIQYYAWALKNRAALMPTHEAFMETVDIVKEAKERLKGILVIDFVLPDYYAKYPKPCMGGWASGLLSITPAGKVLPCHASESIPGLQFDNVKDKPLLDIWMEGNAFQAFRGTDWMKEPCRSCDRKEIDFGGCRCQAYALTGDATNTDPACSLSPFHDEWAKIANEEAHKEPPAVAFRRLGGNKKDKAAQPTPAE